MSRFLKRQQNSGDDFILNRTANRFVFEKAKPATQLLVLAEVARGSTFTFSAHALEHKTVLNELRLGVIDIEKRVAIAEACERLFRASKED